MSVDSENYHFGLAFRTASTHDSQTYQMCLLSSYHVRPLCKSRCKRPRFDIQMSRFLSRFPACLLSYRYLLNGFKIGAIGRQSRNRSIYTHRFYSAHSGNPTFVAYKVVSSILQLEQYLRRLKCLGKICRLNYFCGCLYKIQ